MLHLLNELRHLLGSEVVRLIHQLVQPDLEVLAASNRNGAQARAARKHNELVVTVLFEHRGQRLFDIVVTDVLLDVEDAMASAKAIARIMFWRIRSAASGFRPSASMAFAASIPIPIAGPMAPRPIASPAASCVRSID